MCTGLAKVILKLSHSLEVDGTSLMGLNYDASWHIFVMGALFGKVMSS